VTFVTIYRRCNSGAVVKPMALTCKRHDWSTHPPTYFPRHSAPRRMINEANRVDLISGSDARCKGRQRGPMTVGRALEAFQFAIFREDGSVPTLRTDALVLVCCEVQRPSAGKITFRVVDAWSAGTSEREVVQSRMAEFRKSPDCEGALFALIAAMPQLFQDQLLPKIRDAVAVGRVFSIPIS